MRTISMLASVLFIAAIMNAQSDSVYVRTGADGKSWTIGNALWSGKCILNRSAVCTR